MAEIEMATAATVAKKNTLRFTLYQASRLSQMPKIYQGIYNRAVTGKSRKAAVHAFCLECVGWERNEVALCTDVGCPLFPYRPFKRLSVKKGFDACQNPVTCL